MASWFSLFNRRTCSRSSLASRSSVASLALVGAITSLRFLSARVRSINARASSTDRTTSSPPDKFSAAASKSARSASAWPPPPAAAFVFTVAAPRAVSARRPTTTFDTNLSPRPSRIAVPLALPSPPRRVETTLARHRPPLDPLVVVVATAFAATATPRADTIIARLSLSLSLSLLLGSPSRSLALARVVDCGRRRRRRRRVVPSETGTKDGRVGASMSDRWKQTHGPPPSRICNTSIIDDTTYHS